MDFSDEKIQQISDAITKAGGQFRCPVCGQPGGFSVYPREYDILSGNVGDGKISIGGHTVLSKCLVFPSLSLNVSITSSVIFFVFLRSHAR